MSAFADDDADLTLHTGLTKTGTPTAGPPGEPLPYTARLTDWEQDRIEVQIPDGPYVELSEQSAPTDVHDVSEPGHQGMEFQTYTPVSTPSQPGLFTALAPPDMTGADSGTGVVAFCGNTYLCVSSDNGATFKDLDSTTFDKWTNLPGRPVDQVMIYVPRARLFAWMMQHEQTGGTGDGNFRLAVARPDDLANDPTRAWWHMEVTSSDLGFSNTATDRQDLAFTDDYLYLTTTLVGQGRVVMRIPLNQLTDTKHPHKVDLQYTDPLAGRFSTSDLSQQNTNGVYMAAIKDSSTLHVWSMRDNSNLYKKDGRALTVSTFPNASDLSSNDPDGKDWLTVAVPNVSAVLAEGDFLWIAWDASASPPDATPLFPNAHVRLARLQISTWTKVEERQVWHPDYAYAYATLARDFDGRMGYGVGVGGPHDYPHSSFGILGDNNVYHRDISDTTAIASAAGGGTEARWGDYITVRPSEIANGRKFAAFGYFTKKQPTGPAFQTPFFLIFPK